jgi:hypothetical protein
MGSLAFLNPLYLTALAAIAVPIIIHFIHRKKAVRWRFAAMEFLLRSHRKVARRIKLKQLLLLLLRCLLFAIFATAFARPFLRKASGNNPSKARAIVLIVDDSMSMSYRSTAKGQTFFARGKARALKLLKQLRGEDQVALLRGSAFRKASSLEQVELTFDKGSVSRKLEQWQPSYRTTDLTSALRRASVIFQKVKGSQPVVIVVSDFARHAMESIRIPKLASFPTIELLPIRDKVPPSNRAIVGLKTEPAPFASSDAYQFTVRVQNVSKQAAKDLSVQLVLGNQPKAKGFVNIPALGTAEKQFVVRLPRAGVYTGYVEIGDDGLQADNRFYFALQARQRPHVLLVNGDPRTIPYLDELYYVDRALQELSSPFVLKTVHASSMLPSPDKFQAIFLVNVRNLPTAWVSQVRRFVRKGGGLMLTMGNQVSVSEMNQQFDGLLPRPLRRVALAAQRPDGTGIALQRYFGEVTASHPIFQRLYRDGLVFQSARVSRLMLVETRKAKQTGQVLWRFSHGPPALLERRVGSGRVLLMTTTLDRDWTDLCIRPFFQPWLKRVTTYLAGGARFQQSPDLVVDQSGKLTLPDNRACTVTTPRKKTFVLRPSRRVATFPGGSVPGIYRFSRDGKSMSILPKIVNVDPKESDLSPIAAKQLRSLGTVTSSVSTLAFKQSERFWPFLFFCLLLVFFAEAVVLRFV